MNCPESESIEESGRTLPSRLFRHVDMLAGVIGPRHPGKPGSMEATAAYIEGELHASGLTVTRETYSVRGQPTDNVVVMLETARLLKGIRPKRTVRFVAFACEESPYFHTGEMGSMIHAQGCSKRGENVVAMLCLEMVGYFFDEKSSQQVPPAIPGWLRWLFPSRGNFLAAVGNLRSWKLCWQFRRGFKKATRFPLFSVVLPEGIPEIHLSDHRGFWIEGFPALMLTDTSFLRNPHYHLSTDTADTLDYQRMAEVTVGVASALQKLARASQI